MNNYVTRINLKTDSKDRKQLIDFCLHHKNKQYLVMGWSGESPDNGDFQTYYDVVRSIVLHKPSYMGTLNIFKNVEKDDLFWTRDLEGNYWICRALGSAVAYRNDELDIGAVIPVEAYQVGLEVPGQISASFNRPRGGITQKIYDENKNIIINYSQYMYNKKSGNSIYTYKLTPGDFFGNLPPFELEELVISYLQVKENYYVLSNSIANKSTTIKIECELYSRELPLRKAVVQVKAANATIDAKDYASYAKDGYTVYFYAPKVDNLEVLGDRGVWIKPEELRIWYYENKAILPESITKWENLFVL